MYHSDGTLLLMGAATPSFSVFDHFLSGSQLVLWWMCLTLLLAKLSWVERRRTERLCPCIYTNNHLHHSISFKYVIGTTLSLGYVVLMDSHCKS